jgi:hypothetical protein
MADKKPFIYAPRVPGLTEPSISIQPPTLPELQLPDPKVIQPYAPKQSSYMNYNDPYQINSIADIILGTFSKDMNRDSFNIGGLDLSEVPILNMIPATFQYVNDAYLRPISRGDWGAVGLNTLTNFSEVMDTLANPIKGAVLEGKEGFKNALGLGDGGRQNYDYNTGNVVGDIVLELVSDPVNWVTLFGKGAVSSLVKRSVREGLESIGQETGQQLSEVVYKKLTKKVAQVIVDDSSKAFSDVAVEAAKDLIKPGKAILWKNATPPQFTEAFMDGLKKFTVDDMTVSVLNTANKIIQPAEVLDKTLTKVGIGVPYAAGYIAKKYGGDAFKYIASKIKDGYKPYRTPSGNLDLLKYDDIKQYTEQAGSTAGEYDTLSKEFPTQPILKVNRQEAVLREKDNITHFMKTDLKDIPNSNMAHKVAVFKDFLQNQTGLDDKLLMETIQDINTDTKGQYKWLENWMMQYLDPEQAVRMEQRAKIWDMFHDIKDKVQDIKTNPTLTSNTELEQYIKNTYNLTTEELITQAKDYHIVLGDEFDWISDYFKNSISDNDSDLKAVYLHKREITNQVRDTFKNAKKLEGDTRFLLIDDFIRGEHGIGIEDYITKLEEISLRHDNVFKDYIEELEQTVKHLQLMDKLDKEYAEKRVAKEIVTHNNALLKIQTDILAKLPKFVKEATTEDFRDTLMLSDPDKATIILKGRYITHFNPKAFAEAHTKAGITASGKPKPVKFTKKLLNDYMQLIHNTYQGHINAVAKELVPEGMIMNDAYEDIVNKIIACYEERWPVLEQELRKQSKALVEQFDVYNFFDDMPKRINTILELADPDPKLATYRQVLAKKDILNNTETFMQHLTKDNDAKKETLDRLLTFRTDPRLKHVQGHIIQLQRTKELKESDFFDDFIELVEDSETQELVVPNDYPKIAKQQLKYLDFKNFNTTLPKLDETIPSLMDASLTDLRKIYTKYVEESMQKFSRDTLKVTAPYAEALEKINKTYLEYWDTILKNPDYIREHGFEELLRSLPDKVHDIIDEYRPKITELLNHVPKPQSDLKVTGQTTGVTSKAGQLFDKITHFFTGSDIPFDINTVNIKEDIVEPWAKSFDRQYVRIFSDALSLDFEDLIEAITKQNFTDFLNSADSIVHTLKLTAIAGQEAKNAVQPLIDIFEQYDLGSYKPLSADITAESVWYHFKLEQDYIINLMLADTECNNFMSELLDSSSEIGGMFKNMILDEDPEAKRFSVALNNYMNYRTFLDELYRYVGNPVTDAKLPDDKRLLGAFTSTLQKYATYDPKTFLENIDSIFYYITQQVETQINSVTAPKGLSLEKYAKKLSKMEQYKKLLENLEEHHALDDCKLTWATCDFELGDAFKKQYGDDVKVIHMDIETNDLNKETLEITEFGGYSKDFDKELALEFVRKADNPGAESARLAKTQRTINATTELDLLEKVFGAVEDLYKQGHHNIVLDFYNGSSFDKPAILKSLTRIKDAAHYSGDTKAYESSRHLIALINSKKYQFSDSLKMIQQKYHFTVIAEEDKIKLFYFLKDYAIKQKDSARLIQPLDPSIAKRLKEIGETIREELMSNSSTLSKESATSNLAKYEDYFKHANAVYALFQSVKNANRELSHSILKKSLFDEEDFIKYYGANNITQALNSRILETGERQIFEGTKMFGAKKHLEPVLIQDIFNGKVLDVVQMEYRTNIARDVVREKSMLKNTVMLKYYKDKVKDILGEFIERALRSSRVPEDLKALKVTDDYFLNFAILRKLVTYKTEAFQNLDHLTHYVLNGKPRSYFKADNLLLGLCNDIIPTDLKLILQEPQRVRVRPFLETPEFKLELDLEYKAIWEEVNTIKKTEKKLAEGTPESEEIKLKEIVAYKAQQEYQEYMERMVNEVVKAERTAKIQMDTVASFTKKLELNNVPIGYKGYRKATDELLAHATDLMTILKNLGKDWDTNGAQRSFVAVRSTSLTETFNLVKAVKARHAKISNTVDHYNQVMKYRKITDALALQQMDTVLKLSDDDLFAHLIHNAKKLIIMDGTEMTAGQLKELFERTKNLEAKKIHILSEDNGVYIFLDKDVKVTTSVDKLGKTHHFADGVEIVPPKINGLDVEAVMKDILPDSVDGEIRRSIKAIYDKFYKLVGDYDSDYSPHYGSLGEATTRSYYLKLYENLPDSIKKLLPVSELMYSDDLFHGASFNHSVIGRGSFRKQFDQYTNFDIISMLSHTMTNQVEHLKAHVEYMNMFFDKSLSIGNGGLTKFSDEDILTALKNSDEYRLAALIQDSKGGAKIVDMNPQSIKDIQKARELGAVIMSYNTFSTAFGAINSYSMRHSRWNMLHKINYLYKMGYILTPGALFRNIIDSVVKNYVAAADDPTGMTQSFMSAWQLYWRYKQTAKDLIKFSTDSVTKVPRITPKSTEDFFASGLNKLTKEEYAFIRGFDVDGPSGGQIKEFEEYFRHGHDMKLYSQIIEMMTQPTKTVEQICRLAEYMWAIEKDMPTTKAYALIAKTHFDYTIKTETQKLIELVFPFYTFTMNNIHFWLDALEKFPALGSIIRDVYTPVWNLDDYTPEELQYNRSLQYQILSGNLPLEQVFGDKTHNMTLKLNPSFMDVYQLATDPINAIKGKLNPIVQEGMNVAGAGLPKEMQFAYGINAPTNQSVMQNIIGLLPIAGPIVNRMFVQGPKYYERTGNPLSLILPSLFGATAELKRLNKTPGNYKPYVKYPKKPRRGYAKKPRRFFAKMSRYYPKKVYSSVGYSIDNFYNKLYTKTGKSRLKSMAIPVTGRSLAAQLKNMYYYYKW